MDLFRLSDMVCVGCLEGCLACKNHWIKDSFYLCIIILIILVLFQIRMEMPIDLFLLFDPSNSTSKIYLKEWNSLAVKLDSQEYLCSFPNNCDRIFWLENSGGGGVICCLLWEPIGNSLYMSFVLCFFLRWTQLFVRVLLFPFVPFLTVSSLGHLTS